MNEHWRPTRATFEWRKDIYTSVGCPQCLEPVGSRCVGVRGQRRKSNHRERITAYRRVA